MDDHVEGGDEAVAELMAQHGAARYADVETIAECLGRRVSAPPPQEEDQGQSIRA